MFLAGQNYHEFGNSMRHGAETGKRGIENSIIRVETNTGIGANVFVSRSQCHTVAAAPELGTGDHPAGVRWKREVTEMKKELRLRFQARHSTEADWPST